MNKDGKIGLILGIVLATVLISGCIGGGDNSSDKFSKEVTVEGVTFFIPEDFELTSSDTGRGYKTYSYTEGSSLIAITVYPSTDKSEILAKVKSSPQFYNLDENARYGGYSGFTAILDKETYTRKAFVFEKNGETFAIELSSDLNFDEYVPKIIG